VEIPGEGLGINASITVSSRTPLGVKVADVIP
jgi:hypothetical protein